MKVNGTAVILFILMLYLKMEHGVLYCWNNNSLDIVKTLSSHAN